MTSLPAFQDAFAHALLAQGGAQPPSAFDVYRNTVMKGCIDALEANYPSVARLVGRDWFRSAAALYVRAELPTDGVLLDYGQGLPDFLRRFAPAAGLPYLADVAVLDRFWTACHTAADALPIDAARLARLSPESLMQCRLAPHPAARWAWFDGQPIYSIWQYNRLGLDDAPELLWQPEGALLTRPGDTVEWRQAIQADCAFLDACAQGRRLGDATEAASQADPHEDLATMLARLLQAGALIAASLEPQGATP